MFIKYPSLENHYNVKLMTSELDKLVTVSEKIDGSNASVIAADGQIYFASRNQMVDGNWNDIERVTKEIAEVAMHYHQRLMVPVQIYGEIFANSILRRFKYGGTKFRAFDIRINEKLQSQNIFSNYVPSSLRVPHTVTTLGDALEIDVETIQSAYDETGAIVEGIVVKGLVEPIRDARGDIVAIKKKTKRFSEMKAQKPAKVVDNLNEAQLLLLNYVNEARVKSAESKLGEYDIKRTGEFLKEISTDAIEDFNKDYEGLYLKKDYMSGAFSKKVKDTLFSVYGVGG